MRNPNDNDKDHLVGYLTLICPDQGYQIRPHVIIIIQIIIIISHPLIADAGVERYIQIKVIMIVIIIITITQIRIIIIIIFT